MFDLEIGSSGDLMTCVREQEQMCSVWSFVRSKHLTLIFTVSVADVSGGITRLRPLRDASFYLLLRHSSRCPLALVRPRLSSLFVPASLSPSKATLLLHALKRP